MGNGILALILTLGLYSALQTAEAAPIAYDFGGTVTSVGNPLAGHFPEGQSVRGHFFVEPTRADIESSPAVGTYQAVTGLGFAGKEYVGLGSGSPLGSGAPGAYLGDVTIWKNPSMYLLSASSSLGVWAAGSVGGWDFQNFDIRLVDESGKALSSDAFPTVLNLEDFNIRTFSVTFTTTLPGIGQVWNSAVGALTSLTPLPSPFPTPIPEPSTILLLASGLVGLAVRRLVPR
jgi:hypothetical protein